MPYYIYRISRLGIATRIDAADGYRDAKAKLAQAREAADPDGDDLIRMIFADSELQAEDLLMNPRPVDPAAVAEDD